MSVTKGVRTLGNGKGAYLFLSGEHFAVFKAIKGMCVINLLKGTSSAVREET